MKKIILGLAIAAAMSVGAFGLGGKTESYELIPTAPNEFVVQFETRQDFDNFVNGHADFVEVRYVDEETLSAGIFIDESNATCLGA